MQPLIGIPCHAAYREGSSRPIYANNRTYVHAIEDAGGISVLIPFLNNLDALGTILSRLDGILLPGGIDIQPHHYQEEPHPLLSPVNAQLDALELAMARWALREDMPVLGICRGTQMLNVALGGSLYQDVNTQYPGTMRHMHQDKPRSQLVHSVSIEAGSRMAAVLGTTQFMVNSLHHQSVKTLGRGVLISGSAEDGVVEAIEVVDHRFAMGLQCHPEEIYKDVPACASLFSAFVASCATANIKLWPVSSEAQEVFVA
ncbi:MAG: gamma-glutamyl-gamma-aminobutyrate hydrolase family protein [Ktedonobacteraceae bacterium]